VWLWQANFLRFSKQTSPKMGLESTKPHQKMFLEFSKLWIGILH